MTRMGIVAGLIVCFGLATGCSNNKPASSAPAPGGGAPKSGETKSNIGKGGVENPPPP